jgi:hypothetical protein
MSLLSKFLASPKGDGYRIIENPIKYIGAIFSTKFLTGKSNAASTVQKSNPSSTVTSTTGNNTLPQ